MSTNKPSCVDAVNTCEVSPGQTPPSCRQPLRGAAAAQAGFDYQLDVSILAALQLLLISKAASRLVLEPANEEDLEADLQPNVPGRVQPSATMTGNQKLVVQVKLDNGDPWRVKDFEALLKHGSDKKGGRRKALHHLDDPNTRYLLVTNADATGAARGLLVQGFEELSDKASFPGSLHATLKSSPAGRVAIWGKLTEKQLASDIRELMSDLLHVPKVEQRKLLEQLRLEAKRRTRGGAPGIWTRDDLLATVRAHGGFLASFASLEDFVAPANFDEMVRMLTDRNAVVLRGPSGTGKTQAALKLCDMARRRDGTLDVVSLGPDDAPTNARKVVDMGPTLFYVDDPWGQYSLANGNEAWTEQLPRLLAKASPGHQFVITTRSDMLYGAGVGSSLDTWSVELDAVQYRDGQLGDIYDNRMDQLPAPLQTKAYEFRKDALEKLETPLELELFFSHLQIDPEAEESDHAFCRRQLKLAQRDAVEGVVIRALSSMDTTGVSALVWALLASRAQFDRTRMLPLQRALRAFDSALSEAFGKIVDRMVAARHLRQPARVVAFAHPSVKQGFEAFVIANWVRGEAAIESLISALVQLPEAHREWGLETAARVLEMTRSFSRRTDIDQPFEIDAVSQSLIDSWLDERLQDPRSKFAPLLELASEVGSDASIPSRVARWLLKGTQRGASVFIRNWQPPVFDDDWYRTVAADPVSAQVAERFIREMLGFDRGNYGSSFAQRLDSFAPNLTMAYLDAARQMVGNGFELNADAVATGAIRDLVGFESVLQASLDDLATLRRRYAQDGFEEWRAIEDGERDHAVEEAAQWNHEEDGYTSGVFIDAYVRRLRAEGHWQALYDHPRIAELVQTWSQDLHRSADRASEDELRALISAGKGLDAETNIWAAVRQHWHPALEVLLTERLSAGLLAVDLRDELALTSLSVAPAALISACAVQRQHPERQVLLLCNMRRAQYRLGKSGRSRKLKRITDALSPHLAEIANALPNKSKTAHRVGARALAFLKNCAAKLEAEALALVVPVILKSGGDASVAIAQWLAVSSSKEQAIEATEAAIATSDPLLIEQAFRHDRADARRLALLHLAQALPDPLPPAMLAMAGDPGSRVRRALVSILSERPHPDHLRTLLSLIHDTWSSAELHHHEIESYDVAQEAVIALAANKPLSDEIGDMLLHLANTTDDRTLSQHALIVAVHCCSAGIQQKISNLVNIPEARWIRLDAMDALADAEAIDPSIVAQLTPTYLLKAPPILAASAAHFIGAHAEVPQAMSCFERVASSNRSRALLLVGAAAMALRDSEAAARILDLLEPDHPGRQLLTTSEPLPASILDGLGTVQLREAVRKRLKDRIMSAVQK
ncbi:hypothetical protein JHE03_11685 [Pluralibacter gergoviae]|uniref:nSTAND3 domain-containing NTPase n=1 Tax=Pluralibacter gergoviae TaxID=61647 RepID=UPI00190A84C5|nr:hypothetical protein [Pluralibacter gergoviae]MBK4116957.1 hypothetical protein [Pluralibacter gergoviae]